MTDTPTAKRNYRDIDDPNNTALVKMTDTPLKPEPVAWMRPQARSMILSNWMDGRKPYVAVLEAEKTQDNTLAIYTAEQLDAAVKAEREACAQVAEEYPPRPNLLPLCNDDMNKGAERGMYEAAEEIAAAIRARGE